MWCFQCLKLASDQHSLFFVAIESWIWMFVRFGSFFLCSISSTPIDSMVFVGSYKMLQVLFVFCCICFFLFAWRQLPQWHNASYDFLWLAACIFVEQLFFNSLFFVPFRVVKVFGSLQNFDQLSVEEKQKRGKSHLPALPAIPDSTKPNSGGRKDTIAFECSMGNAWCSSDAWLFWGEFFVTHIFCSHQKKRDENDENWWVVPSSSFKAEPLFFIVYGVYEYHQLWRLQIHEESWSSEARLQISTDPFFPAEKNECKAIFCCSNDFPKTMLALLTSLTFSSN